MALRIEDYALIGDTHTVALVGANGSIDWLCLPRFDAPACFASLLGTGDNGFWDVAPRDAVGRDPATISRADARARDGIRDARGAVALVDCMPPRRIAPRIVRVVEGVRGEVPMRMRFMPRFDYGRVRPWVSRDGDASARSAGPDALELRSDVPVGGDDSSRRPSSPSRPGSACGFLLTFHLSWEAPPPPIEPGAAIAETEAWWREWSGRSTYRGGWADAVERSLITLKALTYEPTGGIVAAATTSLPEFLGGVRNWDYRYCWLRDAALTLDALMAAGYVEEAARVARLGAARGGRRSRRPPDHVRPRRGAAAGRVRARLAARLRAVAPGAGRQRRVWSAAAGRVRRGHRRHVPGPRARDDARCPPAGPC